MAVKPNVDIVESGLTNWLFSATAFMMLVFISLKMLAYRSTQCKYFYLNHFFLGHDTENWYKNKTSLLTFTCPRSTIEKPKKGCEIHVFFVRKFFIRKWASKP